MSCNHDCANCNEKCEEKDLRVNTNKYSNINRIIAVVSGKGGVGKSMVTSLLASQINKEGYCTGILDADITGPSIPKAFGVNEKLAGTEEGGIFPASSKEGILMVSTNLILDKDTDPVFWRGPVISGVVTQFYTDTIWGDVNYMFVDMPPGTGDVPLTVFQSLPVDAIVIVTSPQDLVNMIVEKAINFANTMKVKILGVVENLSYFHCPDNNKDYEIFGHSKTQEICERLNVPFLGRLPIDPEIASKADKGEIESYSNDNLKDIANKIIKDFPLK